MKPDGGTRLRTLLGNGQKYGRAQSARACSSLLIQKSRLAPTRAARRSCIEPVRSPRLLRSPRLRSRTLTILDTQETLRANGGTHQVAPRLTVALVLTFVRVPCANASSCAVSFIETHSIVPDHVARKLTCEPTLIDSKGNIRGTGRAGAVQSGVTSGSGTPRQPNAIVRARISPTFLSTGSSWNRPSVVSSSPARTSTTRTAYGPTTGQRILSCGPSTSHPVNGQTSNSTSYRRKSS